MSVRVRKWQRKDGTWGKGYQAYVTKRGKKVRVLLPSESAARLVEAEMRVSGLRGKYSPEVRKMTVKTLSEHFLQHIEGNVLFSNEYRERHEAMIRNYVLGGPPEIRGARCAVQDWPDTEGLGAVKLHDLTRGRIKDFMTRLQEAGATYWVRLITLGTIQQIIRYAMDKDLLEANPAHGISVKKTKEEYVGPVIVPDLEHVDLMLLVASPVQRLVIVLSLTTQLRVGELMALRWSDLDLRKRIGNIEFTLNDYEGLIRVKSEKGIRTVLITDVAYEEIQRYFAAVGPENIGEFVFSHKGGHHTRSSFHTLVSSLFASADKYQSEHPDEFPELTAGITWKAMRHLGLSAFLEAGINPIAVQLIAGHSTLDPLQQTYAHLVDSAERKVKLARADDILFGKANRLNGNLINDVAYRSEQGARFDDDDQLLLPFM